MLGAMKRILVLHSSGRVDRSLTRRLAERFARIWTAQSADDRTIHVRDLTLEAPSPVTPAWIQAAFSAVPAAAGDTEHALAWSDRAIDEIRSAERIVIGAPLYNFGMPSQLKAYFDQIIRVGRTFDYVAGEATSYRGLLPAIPVVVITSAGEGEMLPGGTMAHLNFLEPHLATLLAFIGLTDVTFVRVGYEEAKDSRFHRSLAAAEAHIDELAAR